MSDEVVIVEVVKRMERDLKQFDLILFFTGEKEFVEEWISCAVKAAELKDSSKKIGILSDSDISNQNCCNCVYRRVDRGREKYWNVYILHMIFPTSLL